MIISIIVLVKKKKKSEMQKRVETVGKKSQQVITVNHGVVIVYNLNKGPTDKKNVRTVSTGQFPNWSYKKKGKGRQDGEGVVNKGGKGYFVYVV
jgi:hypothetical protein